MVPLAGTHLECPLLYWYPPGVSLAVLVPGVPDDLPGEREQFVPPGEQGGHVLADLGGGLVDGDLGVRWVG